MGQLDPHLVDWFDRGLHTGQFRVSSGRHIILNQFPRLMKESRLCASAGVASDELRRFLLAINPNFVVVPGGSPLGIRRQLACERDELPAVRKVITPVLPNHVFELFYVYTPPLAAMRVAWARFSGQRPIH